MVYAYDLDSALETPLTPEQARESIAYHNLDFEDLEDNEEITLDEDLDELDVKVSNRKAKRAAKKCCPNRVTFSSFEHKYVKQF